MVKISFQPAVAGIKADKADKAAASGPASASAPAAEILLTPAREERPPRHRSRKGGSVGGVCYLSMGMVVLLMGLVFASVYIYRYFFLAQLARDNFFHCGVLYEDSLSSQIRTRLELEEDVKIYLEENYERINVPVPQFGGGDPADIIHDFQRGLTAYHDISLDKCYVIELNTTIVLPPRNFWELLMNVKRGTYLPQTYIIQEEMVVTEHVRVLMLKRAQDAEEKWTGAQALMEQMKMTFCEKEKELENTVESLKRQQERELFRLNQENYILQAKLSSFEETSRKQRWLQFGETSDPLTGEKLKQIQKEIQEQETLLQGYQQENERLYNQVKDLQEQNKKNEERMFKENQNLFSELASLKEQMHKNRFLSQAVENTEPTKNQSFTDLLAELRAAQKEKNHLMEDIKRLKQDKQALEVDLEKVKRERDQAKDQIAYATGEKLYEIKILEETHKQEVSRLQKRLQWYAENQELLDRDAARLREANEETEKLRLEIEKLKTESGSPATQQRLRSKERALDAKRIQDLERQVKEMEGILKRRYPNSLPALILAASAAGDSVDRNTVEFMERRIKKLEADLEGKDEEAKKSLRTMEQQFQKMKIQYEQRLEEQEQLLAHRQKEAPQSQRNSSSRLKALETELGDIKEAHQITVRKLEAEIDVLKHQNADLEHKKNDKGDQGLQSIEFQVEQAQARAKLARLNEELAAKGREIQDLTKTVERLQKERRMMLSRQIPRSREETAAKRLKKDPNRGHGNAFPETLDGKLYHPHTFTDSHISEVLEENYRLRSELEGLILERSKLKMESEAAVCQLENSMKRVKDDAAAHIASLKASHEREIEKLLCQNAIENSSSKVAELNRKIATQEVLLKHFQGQVNELQGKQESLAVSQVREEILQKQITKLLEELKEAKENHTPEMKHFMGLERKIKQMEMRHRQREQELQQIIQQTRQVVETEQNKEVEKWKRLAQLKNRELDKFRTELDSILDVLRELHRQGVVVPMALAGEENTAEF